MNQQIYLILGIMMGFLDLQFPLLAQNAPIPVDSVEYPEIPTGNSEDIQGIERNVNNWNWGMSGNPGGNNGERSAEFPYRLTPDYRSPQDTRDDLKWQNIGEPTSEGAKFPVSF